MLSTRVHSSGLKVVVSPTRDAGLVVMAVLFAGLAVLGMGALLATFDYCCGIAHAAFLGPLGICSFFLVAGAFLFWLAVRPINFDLQRRVFWFGFGKKPDHKLIPISEIRCLKNHVTFDSSYTNGNDQYSLVAVMNSGVEMTFAYYAYLKDINLDGKKLAQLLKVPYVE